MSPAQDRPLSASPWHQGERRLQALTGDVNQMEAIGRRFVRDHMPDQHRAFFAGLPFAVLGVVDEQGQPWATVLEGRAGFLRSPDPRRLHVGAVASQQDPAQPGLRVGAPVGMLGIEPHTRRRNRMNGRIVASNAQGFDIEVRESFGNCPQYIQAREPLEGKFLASPSDLPVEHFSELDPQARRTIEAADTFFVASSFSGDEEHPEATVDVSHRGGKPGFVRVQGNTLLIPDFSGNRFFNTLGNLLINPRAGLLFVDHESGAILQLAGSVDILLQGPEVHGFMGAERLWRVAVDHAVRRLGAWTMRTRLVDYSPSLAATGGWPEERPAGALAQKDMWRALQVSRIERESDTVRSIYLESQGGPPLPDFLPGQYLPVKWPLEAFGQTGEQPRRALIRNYSLSQSPTIAGYRISVQRDGQVSSALHAHLNWGDLLQVGHPQGQFVLNRESQRPVLLLAGGIGITPLLSMLYALVEVGERSGSSRSITLVYASRTVAERAFDAELAALLARAPQTLRLVRVLSRPESTARMGVDHDAVGRVDASLLKRLLGAVEHEVYVCGPPAFSQTLYDSLRMLHVPDACIHAESFGPAALRRSVDPGDENLSSSHLAAPSSKPVTVSFSNAGKQVTWTPASGNLLELAEDAGLSPLYGCRGGHCGSCRTRVLEGRVTYLQAPVFQTEADEALICCALPAHCPTGNGDRLVLDL